MLRYSCIRAGCSNQDNKTMKKQQTFFITGTDTDAGKTVIACALLEKARQLGKTTLAIKPVASGCKLTPEGLRNDDALALSKAMTLPLSYDEINPVAFELPIAPHIAAHQQQLLLSSEQLAEKCSKTLQQYSADFALIEGAGGWRIPLAYAGNHYLSDLPKHLNIPVILVIGVKLGCINHARLTVEAITADGLHLAGWVANNTDPHMLCFEENIKTLQQVIPGNFLGYVPYLSEPSPEHIANYLFIDMLEHVTI